MGPNELQRINAVDPILVEGVSYYKLSDVCDALRANSRYASRLLQPDMKRRKCEFHRGYRSKIYTIVNRRAVEQLAIKFGSSPRAEIMANLRT